MSNDDPIRLLLDPSLKVAGQVLEGAVDLYWPGIREKNIEEVVLKLRGKLKTYIFSSTHHLLPINMHCPFSKFDRYTNNAEGERTNHSESQYVNLVHQDMTLWQLSSGVVPPPGSPILRLPFQITLPDELPPSCDIGTLTKKGSIGYYLEAVGKRSGLHFDKRSTVVFPLIPSLSSGAQLREALQQGWRGPWKTIEQEKQIRRGIWGEYSHVKMIVLILFTLRSQVVFTDLFSFIVRVPGFGGPPALYTDTFHASNRHCIKTHAPRRHSQRRRADISRSSYQGRRARTQA
jgi:hypothetical protein